MIESRHNLLANRITWVARIIGLITTSTFLALLIVEIIRESWYSNPEPINANTVVILLECLALVGIIVSWWRVRFAGILLTVASIGLGIQISIYADNHTTAWLIISLPYLVASVLLFTSWRLLK